MHEERGEPRDGPRTRREKGKAGGHSFFLHSPPSFAFVRARLSYFLTHLQCSRLVETIAGAKWIGGEGERAADRESRVRDSPLSKNTPVNIALHRDTVDRT